jgi:O-acetyl-ADP-ribose deacetylase (regulator of RNase III)
VKEDPLSLATEPRGDDPNAYRLRAQACPRGCEFTELARRDIVVTTPRWSWGRARVHATYIYESKNCPLCGAQLTRACARCGKPILAPVRERCTWCGLPHPWASERRSGLALRPVRRWRIGETGVNDPAVPVYRAARGELLVLDGDLLRLQIDAIVSNADVDGRMWTEIAHAVRLQGGSEIERLARAGAPRSLGTAWITIAGDLPAKRVIHVASMNRRGESKLQWVRESLAAALLEAHKDSDVRSLGVPTINSGPAAIGLDEWLPMFAGVCVADLHGSAPAESKRLEIVLVLYEPRNFEGAVEQLRAGLSAAWRAHGEPRNGGVVEST